MGPEHDGAGDEDDEIPPEHQIDTRIELSPAGWAKFCELAGLDAETGQPKG